MALPSVAADKISSAMNHFDSELRTSPQWANWEDNQSYRYAINKDGKLYPVKQIVSMATGASVNSFSGGSEANSYVKERGFEVEPLHLPTESQDRLPLQMVRPDLVSHHGALPPDVERNRRPRVRGSGAP
jgi:5-methylcytosine-specific restriction enzyme A